MVHETKKVTQHIGIVGCSAEGAALCYRTICAGGEAVLGPYGHPEVTMHTPPLADYIACLSAGDMAGVADLMLGSAEVLARAGVDFLICPDNTIHQAFDLVAPHSPLPWLHIAEEVARAARTGGHRRIGVLGTRWLVESEVYPQALAAQGLDCLIPPPEDRAAIDAIIQTDLVRGRFTEPARETHRAAMAGLAARGADAVVLGCTEIPLLMTGHPAPLPMLDSTRLLAEAALARAIPIDHNSGRD